MSLLLAGSASAQDRPPERNTSDVPLQQSIDGVDEEARSLFEAGRSAFAHGRFDDALSHFTRAHELSDRHELLFNMAVCYDRLRRDTEAAVAFRRYLDEVPDAANRAEVEGRIARLEQSRNAGGVERTPPPGDGTTTTSVGTPADESSSSKVLPILGWTFAGLAIASVGASIASWVAADGEYANLERMCLPGGCPADVVHSSSVAMLDAMTTAFLVSAIVLAAASTVVWTVHLATGRDDGVQIAVGPGGVVVRTAL